MKSATTSLHPGEASLQDHLLSECVAMAKYAFASGLKVPAGLVQTLEDLINQKNSYSEESNAASASPLDVKRVVDEAVTPSKNGANHAVRTLATVHSRLAEILAPASPRTVLLLENESRTRGMWGFLGPVGLIRRMMALAIAFLVSLIAIGVTPLVNTRSITAGIFNSSGAELLLNLLFLLSAAGLGACFAGLFQANRYIGNSTFDPKYESSYWIRVVLGLMAGIILAELIPVDYLSGGETGAGPGVPEPALAFVKPVLALLGGFSAAAVYRIIGRMVDSLESLVRGDTRDILAAQEQVSKAQFESQLTQNRLTLAASLTRLQQKIGAGADPEELKQDLDRVLNNLMPAGTFEDPG